MFSGQCGPHPSWLCLLKLTRKLSHPISSLNIAALLMSSFTSEPTFILNLLTTAKVTTYYIFTPSIQPLKKRYTHCMTTLIFLWCKKEGPSWRSKFSGYNLSIIIVLNWKLSNRTSFLIHKRCTIPTHTYLLTTLRFLHNKLFILL